MKSLIVVTVGHVDHGKSTVVGRLLADAKVLPKGKLEEIKDACERNARAFEYAFLLDALKCEQAQGITLDVARCFFDYEGVRYEILDAPGHVELLKNTVTGASHADAAILTVDASRGVEENTRRHAYFLCILGVKQVVVAVNKMDLVAFDRTVYDRIRCEITTYLSEMDIHPFVVPVSAKTGANIVATTGETSWYDGDTLIEIIKGFKARNQKIDAPLRLPLQDVYKFGENDDDRRIMAGEIISGTLKEGDALTFYPSGKRATVKSIEDLNGCKKTAVSGEATGFTTNEDIFVVRGEMVAKTNEKEPTVAVRIRANIFWLGKKPFVKGGVYTLKICANKTEVRIENIESVINASTLEKKEADVVAVNEVATVILTLDAPIVFDTEIDETARFVLVDDYDIAGGGKIIEKLKDSVYDGRYLKRGAANYSTDKKGVVIWLSGLSGSGKSTIAKGLSYRLTRLGVNNYVLDGDELRAGVNADLDFTPKGRQENVLRTAYIANILKQAGVITIVTLISPFKTDRFKAKEIIGKGFYGVYVKASRETCEKRDPKKLYEAANDEKIKDFFIPYEEPVFPDLVIDTESIGETKAVDALFDFLMERME